MFINNNFAKDTFENRSSRFTELSNHIEEYAIELGLLDDILLWAKEADTQWMRIWVGTNVDGGEEDVEYQIFHREFRQCYKFFNGAKRLLLSMIIKSDDANEIIEEYGIKGSTSRVHKLLLQSMERMITTGEKLRAEGDERVLPVNIATQLEDKHANLVKLWYAAIEKKRYARENVRLRRARFDDDTRKLKFLYSLCVMKWGNNDLRLNALGFLRKQSIWTFKNKGDGEGDSSNGDENQDDANAPGE